MANIASNQCFYSLTLEPASAVTHACLANLLPPPAKTSDEQLIEVKGSRLVVSGIRRTDEGVQLVPMCEHDCFGIIRGITSFRIPGTKTGKSI